MRGGEVGRGVEEREDGEGEEGGGVSRGKRAGRQGGKWGSDLAGGGCPWRRER